MMNQQQKGLVALCPKCQQAYGTPVKWTWWGGMLGPRMFNHVRCPSCKTEYNGKTGQSNTNNIIIYFVVSFVIMLVIFALIAFLRH